MKVVLKMLAEDELEQENKNHFDSAKFWARIETPDGKVAFTSVELFIDTDDYSTFTVPRPSRGSLFRLFPPKPFPAGTVVSLAYRDENCFELWSSEVRKYLGATLNGLDEYKIGSFKQEMSSSERARERYEVGIPFMIEPLFGKGNKIYCFSGCEINENGLGLWFPAALKSKIEVGKNYLVTFTPREVEPFEFEIRCVRPHSEDFLSKGFSAGFSFVENKPNSIAAVRLKQLIAARGKLPKPNLTICGHPLSAFWEGEKLKEFVK